MQTKDIQGELWSTAPTDWQKLLEPTFIPMYQEVLKHLKLDEQHMLLDAGCGAGLFLHMVSSAGATVHGIDAAPGLLSISKKRLPNATLLIEDLEDIPFGDETFDCVTGFNSFQYAGNFENAVTEAKRVLKKEGKLVIGIWGKEAACEAGNVLKAVGSLLPPPPPGTPGPFALSETGKMEAVCNSVGLKIIEKQTVYCPWQFIGNNELEAAFMSTAPCVKAALKVGEKIVRETITKSAQPFRLADEIYFMRNEFSYYITEKI